MASATFHTDTDQRMMELAEKDEKLAQRMHLLRHRVVEEFYDIQNDPDCLVNLIADPQYKKDVEALQSALESEMRRTNDPVLPVFIQRADSDALAAYMNEQERELEQKRAWTQAIRDRMKERKIEAAKLQKTPEDKNLVQ